MPTPLPVGESIARVAVLGTYQGQRVVNILHFRSTAVAGLDPNNVATAATAWVNSKWGSLMALLVDNYGVDGVDTQLSTPTTGFVSALQTVTLLGGVTTAGLPAEVAAVVKKLSGIIGRANRGRIYVTGIPIAGYNAPTGLFTTTFVGNLIGWANTDMIATFTEPVSGSVWIPCVCNKALTHVATISSGNANVAPRTQRRRQIGKGK